MKSQQKEILQDIHDYDTIKASIERGEEELIPAEVVYALLDGNNPIEVWREPRGFTQQQVAEAAGISTPYLSQLETGERAGRMDVLLAIARTLKVDLDDIVSIHDE